MTDYSKPPVAAIITRTAIACASTMLHAGDVTTLVSMPGTPCAPEVRDAFLGAVLEDLERNATDEEIARFEACLRTVLEALVKFWNQAYQVGLVDGLAWDLDGFDSLERIRVCGGWDSATIDAIGADTFGRVLGLERGEIASRGAAWDAACAGYNAGARDGALAPQEQRTGNAAREQA